MAILAHMQALLPRGVAWTREGDSALTGLLSRLGREFERVEDRARALAKEAAPETAEELLPDWERICGTRQQAEQSVRRAAVLAALRGRGGPSRANLEELTRGLGFETVIREHRPFVAGSRAGAALTQGSWVFVAEVSVPGRRALLLETALRRVAPAHVYLLFRYEES